MQYKVKKTTKEPIVYFKYVVQLAVLVLCFVFLLYKINYFLLAVDIFYMLFIFVSFFNEISEYYNLSISDNKLLFEFAGKYEVYSNMQLIKSDNNKITVSVLDCNNTKIKIIIKFENYNEKIEFLNSYCMNQDFCEEGE